MPVFDDALHRGLGGSRGRADLQPSRGSPAGLSSLLRSATHAAQQGRGPPSSSSPQRAHCGEHNHLWGVGCAPEQTDSLEHTNRHPGAQSPTPRGTPTDTLEHTWMVSTICGMKSVALGSRLGRRQPSASCTPGRAGRQVRVTAAGGKQCGDRELGPARGRGRQLDARLHQPPLPDSTAATHARRLPCCTARK